MRAMNEEVIKPHIKVPSNPKCFLLMTENAMTHFVKRLIEVDVHHVDGGTTTIQNLHDIIENILHSR